VGDVAVALLCDLKIKNGRGNVVAELALPKARGSGVRDARRKWREESG